MGSSPPFGEVREDTTKAAVVQAIFPTIAGPLLIINRALDLLFRHPVEWPVQTATERPFPSSLTKAATWAQSTAGTSMAGSRIPGVPSTRTLGWSNAQRWMEDGMLNTAVNTTTPSSTRPAIFQPMSRLRQGGLRLTSQAVRKSAEMPVKCRSCGHFRSCSWAPGGADKHRAAPIPREDEGCAVL